MGTPVTSEPNAPGSAYFVANDSGLVRLDEHGFTTVLKDPQDLLRVVPGLNGALWLLSYNAVIRLDDEGSETFQGSGQSTAFDDLTIAPNGDIPAVKGQVRDIYVVGNGPALPASVGPVRTSPIVGKLTQKGEPAVSASVEICPNASTLMRKTPCEGQPFVATAVTGADGSFRVEHVPLGAVQIGFKAKDESKWTVPMGSCCVERTADKTSDLGTIEITKGATAFLFK